MLSSLLIHAQTLSSVYENDLCVTKFLTAYGDAANAYREHGKRLLDEDRLDPTVFKECINVDWWRYEVTDEELNEILARCHKCQDSGVLCRLLELFYPRILLLYPMLAW